MRAEAAIREAAIEPTIDFSGLAPGRLRKMSEAGQEVLNVFRVLAKTGDNVVGELLRGQGTFYEWDHYPPGDIYDSETHSQYYYHAHAADNRFEGEHGHFHTFLRPKGMPKGIKPAPIEGAPMPKDFNDRLSHLIAISMSPAGFPFRLFTVNRWVTAEVWYRAEDVIRMLDLFEIDHTRPSWPVNRWLGAMIRLYRPQIESLIIARDRKVAEWQRRYPEADVYEDRNLEITSFIDIDIDAQVQAVEAARAEMSRCTA
jgi:hypothetical protein